MIWAGDVLSRLKELAQLGLTPSRIAERMHISKNAVSGAMHRHVLAEPKPPRSPEPQWPTANECRFILDNGPWKGGKTPIWCAQRVLPGSPYCPDHHYRCYARFPHRDNSVS